MIKKSMYTRLNPLVTTKTDPNKCKDFIVKALLTITTISWLLGAAFIVYRNHHKQSNEQQFFERMKQFENSHIPNHNDHHSVINIKPKQQQSEQIQIPPTCGIMDRPKENTYVKHYGEAFNPPIRDLEHSGSPFVYNAFGCSYNKKYCVGEPKSIPCCGKIMFDMWHAFDPYLIKHNVTYSFRWGSLLFAVRNGQHLAWEHDIDLGFMSPRKNVLEAIKEFNNDYGTTIHPRFDRHIVDTNVFYKLHHEKYGYPDPKQKYCFVDAQFHTGYPEYLYEDTLDLANIKDIFLDLGYDSETAYGMDLELSHGKPMIPVDFDGPNGIKPPRQMYVYPDFYKHLNAEFGEWKWAEDMVAPWITDEQLEVMCFICCVELVCIELFCLFYFKQYHGYDPKNMDGNWKKFKKRMVDILGADDDFVKEFLSGVN